MLDFLRRIFGGEPARPDEGATTAPLSDQQVQSIIHGQNMPYEMQQLVAASGQSVGKQREHNEDSLFALTLTLALSTRFPAAAPGVWRAPDGRVWLDVLETLQSRFPGATGSLIVYHRVDVTAALRQ